MSRTAPAVLAAAALAACSPAQPPQAEQPAPHPPTPLLAGPSPAPPAWSRPFIGRIVTAALPQKETCLGNTDRRIDRYAGPPAGTAVGGWGWDSEARRPVEHVLLTDETLRVWGARSARWASWSSSLAYISTLARRDGSTAR
jgi:hypothetical protein